MSAPRLSSSVLVTALLRLTEQAGGFGTVLARGDRDAGSILLLVLERGRRDRLLERVLQGDGSYGWSEAVAAGQNEDSFDKFLARRRKFDPDSWILELDVASAERFAAQISALD